MSEYIPMPQSAFLALRPGEIVHLAETMIDQSGSYAVMLHETPALPGKQHIESLNLTVLCAGWYSTEYGASGNEKRWGWVHLEADTKEMIGNALQSIDAIPGQWYYLYISGGVGHRPHSHLLPHESEPL